MSLIIKGMELPKNGESTTITVYGDGVWCAHFDNEPHGKAVPFPEKHGRLIDAAEVLKKAENSPWFDGDVSELGLLLGSEVTTIVPAEGGTDDGN